jgi:adenosylmethionine-8-amino-7-oxononanoate aminotransferase
MEKHDLIHQSAEKGQSLLEMLKEKLDDEIIGDARGKGLFIGIEFVKDKMKKVPFNRKARVAESIADLAFKKGLHILPGFGSIDGVSGDHILIAPPFIISEEEMEELVSILNETIKEVKAVILR